MAEDEQQNNEERLRKAFAKRMKQAQIEQQKREIAQKYLTPEAYERLMNVRISNSEVYDQLINLIVAMVQNNRFSGKITEAQLKSILEKITARPDTTIEFRHK